MMLGQLSMYREKILNSFFFQTIKSNFNFNGRKNPYVYVLHGIHTKIFIEIIFEVAKTEPIKMYTIRTYK